MKAKLKLEGLEKVLSRIQTVASRVKDTAPLMARLATLGFKDVIDHFSKEQGPEGKWAPLKPSTIARRRKKGGGAKILQDTGRLRGSIMPQVTSPTRAEIVSTNVVYAPYHQFGVPGRNLPARPFLWLSRQSIDAMQRVAANYLFRGK